MSKAYIVTTYRSISNPDALSEYAKLAGPAMIAAAAASSLAATPPKLTKREWSSALSSSNSTAWRKPSPPGYQAALKVLGNTAERDIRIVEALA